MCHNPADKLINGENIKEKANILKTRNKLLEVIMYQNKTNIIIKYLRACAREIANLLALGVGITFAGIAIYQQKKFTQKLDEQNAIIKLLQNKVMEQQSRCITKTQMETKLTEHDIIVKETCVALQQTTMKENMTLNQSISRLKHIQILFQHKLNAHKHHFWVKGNSEEVKHIGHNELTSKPSF